MVYIVTSEEGRLEQVMKRMAFTHDKKVYFWTVTKGLTAEPSFVDASLADPKALLAHIERSPEEALYVLKDFHPFLEDPKVVRGVRDLVEDLKSSYKTVFFLSPRLTVPIELEKDITVVDYALPSAEDLSKLFDELHLASREGDSFTIEIPDGDRERLLQAALGMTLNEAETAFARAAVIDARISAEDVNVILEEKKQIIRKSRTLEYFDAEEDLSKVGGLDHLKDWLMKRSLAFTRKAREFGLPEPKGVLLLGVQGCGKSLTCKAISATWKLPLLRLDLGAVFGSYIGQSEENIRKALKTAEAVAPCVLWLDEIEKGLSGTKGGGGGSADAGTTQRVFSTILTWLQEKRHPVFVAATANSVQDLPPELLRKGRLDEIFFIDLPTAAEREAIFSIHVKKKKRDPARFPLRALAERTAGFSGAEIENVVVAALTEAFFQDRELEPGDLEKACAETVPLSRTMKEGIDALRSWASVRARPASFPEGAA